MHVKILGQPPAQSPREYLRPLFSGRVAAGFPSPAQDHVECTLDLNALCIRKPAATYFVRVEGHSMRDARILPGDVLVVDRSLEPDHGDIVIACLHGELTVKELCLRPCKQLLPRNPAYPPIVLAEGVEIEIFGVVTFIIHDARSRQ